MTNVAPVSQRENGAISFVYKAINSKYFLWLPVTNPKVVYAGTLKSQCYSPYLSVVFGWYIIK